MFNNVCFTNSVGFGGVSARVVNFEKICGAKQENADFVIYTNALMMCLRGRCASDRVAVTLSLC